jgi:uncharacterized alpha-E superfamily protein
MLSRTANNMFWLARYVERANNVARLIEVAQRMTGMASTLRSNEWASALTAAGGDAGFFAKYDEVTPSRAADFLLRDRDNPSSILSCLETARQNARAVRTALTREMWETINDTWMEARRMEALTPASPETGAVLDWVKSRTLLFFGTYTNTMLRHDGFYFTELGTFLERADNTARILDVKYHILLPSHETVGGVVDYYQWSALLRAVSAARSYHYLYKDRIHPWNVAEMMILRQEMPRSLRSAFDMIMLRLDDLAEAYGRGGECHRLGGELHARLKYGRIDDILRLGLHEFLTDYIEKTALLGDEIADFYLM